MKTERYIMSFTTGGLFLRESVKLATLYLEIKDWKAVREKVQSENLLQARTLTTSERVCSEIICRLKQLGPPELELLVSTNPQEQGCLLWLAICRRYRFIGVFAVEVLRERYISLKTDLHHEDFDAFFNKKSEWHTELDEIKPTTRNKLRQVLFRILQEVEFLSAEKMIQAAMLSPSLLELILHENPREVLFFPMFESELRGSPL
jgi:hypothetical protein